jgi:ribosomal protein S14
MLQANDDTKHYSNYDFVESVGRTRCEFCQEKKYIQNSVIGFVCRDCFKEITKRDIDNEKNI